jgi:ubiquinone/menaquinone biosynthesis C-methylase UbiE
MGLTSLRSSKRLKALSGVFDRIAPSWNVSRRRPMQFIIDFLKGKSGKLLVTGCGSGRHSSYASKQGFKVMGMDFSLEMIKLALDKDPDGFYLVADVRALPFKDKVFDHSLSVAVIHHLNPSEGEKVLKELKRVTKGKSLLSVWLHPKLRGEVMIPWAKEKRFYYLYKVEEFKALVGKVFNKIKHIPEKGNIVLIAE